MNDIITRLKNNSKINAQMKKLFNLLQSFELRDMKSPQSLLRSLVMAIVAICCISPAVAQDRDYLCFTNRSSSTVSVSLFKNGSPANVNLQYLPEGETQWKTFTIGQYADVNSLISYGASLIGISISKNYGFTIPAGKCVYVKANGKNATFSTSTSNYYSFLVIEKNVSDAQVDISGNIMSLLDEDCLQTDVPAYAFYKLFDKSAGSSIVNYLQERASYKRGAFHAAPSLPATELSSYCYSYMFNNCSDLNQAPVLPAEKLAPHCYEGMFYGCSSINYINVNFTSWYPTNEDETINTSAGIATTNWVNGVASNGTFVCPESLDKQYGTSYIPWNPSVSGNTLEEESDDNDYLCFTVTSVTSWIRLDKLGSPAYDLTGKLEYSLRDKQHFTTYTWDGSGTGLQIDLDRNKEGDVEPIYRVYFRTTVNDNTGKLNESSSNTNVYRFVMPTGDHYISASGNIMSLLKRDCDRTIINVQIV